MALLAELEVLILDCQATGARPRGHLLEMGWARGGSGATEAQARLIKLPEGERVPAAVARITGISDAMVREGAEASEVWRALLDEAERLPQQPAPTVVHFARFERPFLRTLAGGQRASAGDQRAQADDQAFPLDIVCTHDIAQRLLPDLPRRGLLALTGYFGRDLGPLRRCAEHVEATAFVWRELVTLLEARGITTWEALRDWLAMPVPAMRPGQRRRRGWPMPREVRLAVPDAPGLYRMQRADGGILYVGKASSLRSRVNSYFRKQRGVPDRLLEMLSQARTLTYEITESALEAALLEPDEIKRHRPRYNVALVDEPRHLWFTTRDLGERRAQRSLAHPIGPFTSAMTLDRFVALANGSPLALGFEFALGLGLGVGLGVGFGGGVDLGAGLGVGFGGGVDLGVGLGVGFGRGVAFGVDRDPGSGPGAGPETPQARLFAEGYARLRAAHPELSGLSWPSERSERSELSALSREELAREAVTSRVRLLHLGTRLWREGRRDRENEVEEEFRLGDEVRPEDIQVDLERVALRAALARRRAKWVTRLVDSAIVWQEPGADRARLIVIEDGEILTREWVAAGTSPPIPPGHRRRREARQEGFTVARFDRLRVLMTELKRVLADGAPVALRLSDRPALADARLAAALSWV